MICSKAQDKANTKSHDATLTMNRQRRPFVCDLMKNNKLEQSGISDIWKAFLVQISLTRRSIKTAPHFSTVKIATLEAVFKGLCYRTLSVKQICFRLSVFLTTTCIENLKVAFLFHLRYVI